MSAYLCTRIIILAACLRREGKTLGDLLRPLREAAEEKEIRLPILEEDFRACGERVIDGLLAYAKAHQWQIAPDNHEGLRVSFGPQDGDGWFLLRLSVHDPVLPLNVESDVPGVVRTMLSKLLSVLDGIEDIDISPIRAYLSKN